jgi:hypothetical protein
MMVNNETPSLVASRRRASGLIRSSSPEFIESRLVDVRGWWEEALADHVVRPGGAFKEAKGFAIE